MLVLEIMRQDVPARSFRKFQETMIYGYIYARTRSFLVRAMAFVPIIVYLCNSIYIDGRIHRATRKPPSYLIMRSSPCLSTKLRNEYASSYKVSICSIIRSSELDRMPLDWIYAIVYIRALNSLYKASNKDKNTRDR